MTGQITLQIVRIMNWIGQQESLKVEVTFLSASNKSYIAHKSLIAQNVDNTLLLNTSFKISYQPDQNHLLCKVSLLGENNKKKQIIGEAVVNLDLLSKATGRVIYLPLLTDQTKIMQIHRIDSTSALQFGSQLQQQNTQNNQHKQEQFLKQRYDFLQQITHNEIEMKKNFSQKVYNLLKDIKYARASQNMKKETYQKRSPRDIVENNQYAYQTPMRENVDREQNKRQQIRGNIIDERIAPRNPKHTKNYKLMIDSIHTYGNKESNYNGRNENKY